MEQLWIIEFADSIKGFNSFQEIANYFGVSYRTVCHWRAGFLPKRSIIKGIYHCDEWRKINGN